MVDPSPLLWLYRGLLPPICGLLPLGRPFSAKMRTALDGRRGLPIRLWKAAEQLQNCVWVHVTSVGEYEQARPVITALKERFQTAGRPIAVTHYSPSGYEFAQKRPCADFHDYLPFDRLRDMRSLVRWWRPRVLIFVKFDFWPNQILAAAEAGVPIVLLAGTLQPRSWRLRPLARPLFHHLFNKFSHLGVCTEADRLRFVETLGVERPVTVTGDTRAEQVILRFEAAARSEVATRLAAEKVDWFVLGSTWPQDEALWLGVLAELLRRHPNLRVVLAPHEPRPDRLQGIQENLAGRGIATERLSHFLDNGPVGSAPPPCLLVDSVGVLADIYRAGVLAYVGGSFTTGVHNTMEPAVAGIPLLFGPVIQNAPEADCLVAKGAGCVVKTPTEALAQAHLWLSDRVERQRAGQIAREVVLAGRGATEKSLALLDPYL